MLVLNDIECVWRSLPCGFSSSEIKVKLPAHPVRTIEAWRGFPEMKISFVLCPLTPPIQLQAGDRGTCRPNMILRSYPTLHAHAPESFPLSLCVSSFGLKGLSSNSFQSFLKGSVSHQCSPSFSIFEYFNNKRTSFQ